MAPDLSLRSFDASHLERMATHVKFVVTSNQCTGQASYHGDQDNDPTINSDCRAPGPTAVSFRHANEVHVAEVQVFGQNPTVDGTKVTTG